MTRYLAKVAAFITRPGPTGHDLLLLAHPHAGIQIPAGTVEPGERPEAAVVREVAEETGLSALTAPRFLAEEVQQLPAGNFLVARETAVYARPATTSFNWATLRRGVQVTGERRAAGFVHVTYREYDDFLQPAYITYQITGWVAQQALAGGTRRTFYHLSPTAPTRERWTVESDNHHFTLFWAPLAALPALVSPQDRWLQYLPAAGELEPPSS